jgi:hypothetical protein
MGWSHRSHNTVENRKAVIYLLGVYYLSESVCINLACYEHVYFFNKIKICECILGSFDTSCHLYAENVKSNIDIIISLFPVVKAGTDCCS